MDVWVPLRERETERERERNRENICRERGKKE